MRLTTVLLSAALLLLPAALISCGGSSKPAKGERSAKKKSSKKSKAKKKKPSKKKSAPAPEPVEMDQWVLALDLPMDQGLSKVKEENAPLEVALATKVSTRQVKLFFEQSLMGFVGPEALDKCIAEMGEIADDYGIQLDSDQYADWGSVSQVLGRCIATGRTPITLKSSPRDREFPLQLPDRKGDRSPFGDGWTAASAPGATKLRAVPAHVTHVWMDWISGHSRWQDGGGAPEECSFADWEGRMKKSADRARNASNDILSDVTLVLHVSKDTSWGYVTRCVQLAAANGISRIRFAVTRAG